MAPKVPGKDYYEQPHPEDRGFERKVFHMRKGEPVAFASDAAQAGFPSSIAYLRHLWNEDRARRGLPEREPSAQPKKV